MSIVRRGFTIVEIMVIVVVITILVALGVAGVSGVQTNGRDAERKIDIETIATHLETAYNSGYDDDISHIGRYPSTTTLFSAGETSVQKVLRDVTANALRAPDSESISLIAATNAQENTANLLPQPTVDQYIYQPLTSDGSLCTGSLECRRYNLYYRLEATDEIKKVASRNQ